MTVLTSQIVYGVGAAQLLPHDDLGLPSWAMNGARRECGLCGHPEFMLWPLATSGHPIRKGDSPGIEICQRCAQSIRPTARGKHLTVVQAASR